MPKTLSPAALALAALAGIPTGDGGQQLQGQLETSSSSLGSSNLPDLAPAPRFLLTHHPNDWELATIDGRDVLIPGIRKQPLVGGIQGIRQTKEGLDIAVMQTRMEQGGWIFLPEDPPYRYFIEVKGGLLHLSIWEKVTVYAGGAADITFDREAEQRWRLSLVEHGIVPPPREGIISKLSRRFGKRIERLQDQAQTVPSAAGRLKNAEEMVERLEEAERPRPRNEEMDRVSDLQAERDYLLAELAQLREEKAREERERRDAERAQKDAEKKARKDAEKAQKDAEKKAEAELAAGRGGGKKLPAVEVSGDPPNPGDSSPETE